MKQAINGQADAPASTTPAPPALTARKTATASRHPEACTGLLALAWVHKWALDLEDLLVIRLAGTGRAVRSRTDVPAPRRTASATRWLPKRSTS